MAKKPEAAKPESKKISDAIEGVAASSTSIAPSDEAGAPVGQGEQSIPQPQPAAAPAESEKPKQAAKPEAKLVGPSSDVPAKYRKFEK